MVSSLFCHKNSALILSFHSFCVAGFLSMSFHSWSVGWVVVIYNSWSVMNNILFIHLLPRCFLFICALQGINFCSMQVYLIFVNFHAGSYGTGILHWNDYVFVSGWFQAALFVCTVNRTGYCFGHRQTVNSEWNLLVYHKKLPILQNSRQGLAGM